MKTATTTLIKTMVEEYNSYAKVYKTARYRMSLDNAHEGGLQLYARRQGMSELTICLLHLK